VEGLQQPVPGADRLKLRTMNTSHMHTMTNGFPQCGRQLTSAALQKSDVFENKSLWIPAQLLVEHAQALQHMACIGQSSERPATDLTDPWRREVQSNALNWQPGAAALLQGPQKTSNAKTTFAAFGPRQGRSTDGMESLKAHAGSAKTGRRGTVGLPRVALCLVEKWSAE
jgi:hypothetical protein